jgi:hypothetical protein
VPGIEFRRSSSSRAGHSASPEAKPASQQAGKDGVAGSTVAVTIADYCLAAAAGLCVLLVTNVHYLLRQPYWLDEAWVADSVRAPLSLVPRLASSTPLGWTLLLRLVPFGGLERQRLVPLAFYALAVAIAYLLGRELRLSRFTTGLLTAAAVLLTPSMLSRGDLKQYTAEACFSVLLWLLVARLENSWRRWNLAALGLATSAGCLFASTAILTGAAAFGCLGLECLARRQWRRLLELAVAGAGTVVIFGVVYVVVLKPRMNPGLAYYWRPRYLPGSESSALGFLRVQFDQLTPYLAFTKHYGPGTGVVVAALAVLGVAALVALGRVAMAALLPVTLMIAIAASAASVYPFGDQRTSTYWLVMVPVLMAIGVAAVIHGAAGRLRTWARWTATLGATAAVLACYALVNSTWVSVPAVAVNPQNPYAQIAYVAAHFRPGDVILVNEEGSYPFAYYYPTPPSAYAPVTTTATGFIPAYPATPWIITLTDRNQRAISEGVAQAVDMIAAEPPGHRGRIWVIRDHYSSVEAQLWGYAMAGGTLTTISFPRRQEPLLVYRPAIHAPAPASLWGTSASRWQQMLSLGASS